MAEESAIQGCSGKWGLRLILSLSPKAGEHTTASRSQYMGISDFYISRLDPLVVTDFMGVSEEVWVGG